MVAVFPLIAAVAWLVHCLPRIPADIREFRNARNGAERVSFCLLWCGTLIAALIVADWVTVLVSRVARVI